MEKLFVTLVTLMALLLGAGKANAITITQYYDSLPDSTPNPTVLADGTVYQHNFQRFNSALGTLKSVTWTITSALDAEVHFFNPSPTVTYHVDDFQVALTSAISGLLKAGGTESYNYKIYSGIMDNGGSGYDVLPNSSADFYNVPAGGTKIFKTYTNALDLAAYTGTSNFTINLAGSGQVGGFWDTNLFMNSNSYFGDVLKLEYEYDANPPVPEPATMLLLGSGLIGLGGALRFRRKQ